MACLRGPPLIQYDVDAPNIKIRNQQIRIYGTNIKERCLSLCAPVAAYLTAHVPQSPVYSETNAHRYDSVWVFESSSGSGTFFDACEWDAVRTHVNTVFWLVVHCRRPRLAYWRGAACVRAKRNLRVTFSTIAS